MASKGHWEVTWQNRPSEEAINFNPAFCGELIVRAVREHGKSTGRPLALPLSFLVLPLALHKQTRDELPSKADTAFVGWIVAHGPLLAAFPDRAARLAPVTREALLLMLQHSFLRTEGNGLVSTAKRMKSSALAEKATADTNEARSAAELIGRWFARQGMPTLVMQGLGVKP